MRQRRETPEPWAGALRRADIGSLTQLAARTGVAVETLARLVHGQGKSSAHTLEAVAKVLKPADARQVPTWAGQRWSGFTPVLPDAARELTATQWAAVEAVINAMVENKPATAPADVFAERRRTARPNLRAEAARREDGSDNETDNPIS